ncbi:MAG: recombinase family protein [Bacteroidota bacterium]
MYTVDKKPPNGNSIIGYARVSKDDQNLALQLDALQKAGCQKVYKEKMSGAKADRIALEALLNYVREGDTVVIWKLDRLGRSLRDLIELVNKLSEKAVNFISITEHIDTSTPTGKLVFHIFGALAEFERDVIRLRTCEGLAAARARQKVLGRPKGLSKIAEQKAATAAALYREGSLSVQEVCAQLAISIPTLYRYLRHRGVPLKVEMPKYETVTTDT